jgi:hypothetical protein
MALNKAAKKWVKALRSGKYKQTQGCLYDGYGYCCLGVACELAKKEGIIEDYDGDMSFPPIAVQNWLELSSMDGELPDSYTHGSLIDYNDEGSSFKKIAQIIEREPDGLFKDKNGRS